jgi:hypothetical protein
VRLVRLGTVMGTLLGPEGTTGAAVGRWLGFQYARHGLVSHTVRESRSSGRCSSGFGAGLWGCGLVVG